MTTATDVRRYEVAAESTATFGRVLCSCRDHHFVADGPVQNGCPGEALTPAELFLAGVAACGVELVQVLAREAGFPLRTARAAITGVLDRSKPGRGDVTLFSAVRLSLRLAGVTPAQGADLVASFKRR